MTMSAFLKDLAERAAKTAAQTAVTVLGADAVNILAVDWQTVLGLSAGAALVSVLTSVASYGAANTGTASLTKAVEPAP